MNRFGNKKGHNNILDELKLTYYIKRDYVHNPKLLTLNRGFTKKDLKSSHYEIYKDYLEIPPLDDVLDILLINRNIWNKVPNPFETNSSLSLAWVGSDVPIVPNVGVISEVPGERKSVITSVRDMMASNNTELIETYEEKMKQLRDIKPTKELIDRTSKSAIINRLILNRAEVGNRLTKITRVAGDKGTLYSTIRSYASGKGDTIIPKTFRIDTENPDDMAKIVAELGPDMNKYWVVRPVHGSRGIGMKIDTTKNILDNFSKWVRPENTEGKTFRDWLFSHFIESFKWKLKTQHPDSTILATKQYYSKNPVIEFGKSSQIMYETKTVKVDGVNVKTVDVVNPTLRYSPNTQKETKDSLKHKEFRDHTFDDTLGRINKGRIWIALDASDGKYTVSVYKKLLFEVCSKEFDPNQHSHYSDIQRIWTDVNTYYYTDVGKPDDSIETKFHLDEVNGARASDLDLCFMVDWEDGSWKQDSHKDTKAQYIPNWGIIKNKFKTIFNIFVDATRDSVHCLSETNRDVNSRGCFQYFGVDFIIDGKNNVWLLEFNTRPWSGYGFWWNEFDPEGIHMPNKYVFTESIIRRFIEPKFKNVRPPYRPLDDVEGIDNLWENVTSNKTKGQNKDYYDYRKVDSPLAVFSAVAPSKSSSNWVKNRSLINIYKDRGWSTFPFPNLVDSPDLLEQGITPYLRGLLNNYDPNTFYDKMKKLYPHMSKSKIINKIFPIIPLLGDKSKMVDTLRNMYPTKDKIPYVCNGECYSWDQIIPFTINVDQKSPNLRDTMHKLLPPNTKLIAKPSMGQQGKGIYISDSIEDIYRYISTSQIQQSGGNTTWTISKYISNPHLVEGRKNHIRTFVLVSKKQNDIFVYKMEPSLLFMASLPYDPKECSKFVTSYFRDDIITKITAKESPYIDMVKDFKSLSNLSQADYMVQNFLDRSKVPTSPTRPSYIPGVKQPRTTVMEKLKNKDNGYEIFSMRVPEELVPQIDPQITQIVKQVIYSISDDILCTNDANRCYQYIALDLMVENTSQGPKVWLLEVNPSPGLKSPTKLLKRDGGFKKFMNSVFDRTLDDKKKYSEGDNLFREVLRLKINENEKSGDLIRTNNEMFSLFQGGGGGSTQMDGFKNLQGLQGLTTMFDRFPVSDFIGNPYSPETYRHLRQFLDYKNMPPGVVPPDCKGVSDEQCGLDHMLYQALLAEQGKRGITCPMGYPYCLLGADHFSINATPTLSNLSGITWSSFTRDNGMVKLSKEINDYIAQNSFREEDHCLYLSIEGIQDMLGRLGIPVDDRFKGNKTKLCMVLMVYIYTGIIDIEMPFARQGSREDMEIYRYLNNVAYSVPFPLLDAGFFIGLYGDQRILQAKKFLSSFVKEGGQVANPQPVPTGAPTETPTETPAGSFGRRRRRVRFA